MFIGRTTQVEYALANCPEPFHDPLRCVVVRANKARSPRQGKVLEQPVAGCPCRFGRKALVPEGLVERVGNLRFRPVKRLENTDTSDKCGILKFFAGPR